jgi:hypothetical protein
MNSEGEQEHLISKKKITKPNPKKPEISKSNSIAPKTIPTSPPLHQITPYTLPLP